MFSTRPLFCWFVVAFKGAAVRSCEPLTSPELENGRHFTGVTAPWTALCRAFRCPLFKLPEASWPHWVRVVSGQLDPLGKKGYQNKPRPGQTLSQESEWYGLCKMGKDVRHIFRVDFLFSPSH